MFSCFKIIGKWLGDKDQLPFNSLKPAGVQIPVWGDPRLTASWSGFSREPCRRTSRPGEKRQVELRQRGAEEEYFLVSALTGLGVF